jgi:hypothetical protein
MSAESHPSSRPRLTPELALDYLAELTSDIRAAVLLDGSGARLAGDEALAAPARRLLEASEAPAIEVLERSIVFAARGAGHALAVVTGRLALPALVLYDLRLVLEDLAAEAAA